MKMNTPLEHQGKPEQGEGLSGPAVEAKWNRIIDKGDQGTGIRTDHQADPDPPDRGDAMDHANPATGNPMRIESILPDLASPGQSVVIQGSDLGTVRKILFGAQEASFDVDGEVLVVHVPDGAGAVEVTVEGADGESAVVDFTIAES